MRVQTKIFLLLVAIVALFVGGLGLIKSRERAKFLEIARERTQERSQSFDEFLARQGENLEMLAKDYTYWDAMVRAIKQGDSAWVGQNVNDATWVSSGAHAVWIYKPDGTRFYSADRLFAGAQLQDLPLPPAVFDALAKERLMHFFMKAPEGIMEVRAATVHPSTDSWRQTPPQGFFFAARLWSNEVIKQLGRDSNNFVRFASPNEPDAASGDAPDGIVNITRVLRGWDGAPIARLIISNESDTVKQLNRSSEQLVALLILFALVVLLLLTVSLTRWVSRPLGLISQTLETENLALLDEVGVQNGKEFAGLAKLIREFFNQRASLIAEINERKIAQEALRHSGEQLRQAQKMEAVGRLAGGVAHDFNNLLTAILGYSELLSAKQDLDPASQQNVQMIRKAGQQAAAVTHQLLAFSRKQILQPRVIDLNALVTDFEKILRRVIGEHIDLRTRAGATCGRVKADPNQIEQVILNLGVNARDAMPKGGVLTICTDNVHLDQETARQQAIDLPAGDYVLLAVSDTGYGMDNELKSRIFEPFFTTKGPGKGTGLGLATVYGVVKQSGGAIAVESAPGEGCTFRVYLPFEAGEVDDVRPKHVPETAPSALRADTVLVVEDEEIVRELVCQVLSGQGYKVLCAGNGVEALELSRKHEGNIRLLITDVVMPQIGGLELSRMVTAQRPDTQVLFVSGYSEDDISEHGILDPHVEFLEKPFTPQALTQKVSELLAARPLEGVASPS